jgi:prolyl oligopeptidase
VGQPPSALWRKRQRKPAVAALALLFWGHAAGAAVAGPPAPIHDQTEDYFGTTVHDPYRWMEQGGDDFTLWLHRQGEFTRNVLDSIPGRRELLEQLQVLDRASDQIGSARHCHGRWLYSKTLAGADVAMLYVRDGNGTERTLVDPRRFDRGTAHAQITEWVPSWDCAHVAYGIALAGAEIGMLRIVDVDRGEDLPDIIDKTYYAIPSWLPDGSGFFYRRLAEVTGSRHDVSHMRVYLHKIGADPDSELPLAGTDVAASVVIPLGQLPWLVAGPDSPFVILAMRAAGGDVVLYAARLDALAGTHTPWRAISSLADHVRAFALHGGEIYLAVARDAPRNKVLKLSLSQPDMAHAVTIVPEGRGAIENIDAAADALYIEEVEGGPRRVLRLPWSGAEPAPVPLPPGRDFTNVGYQVLASVPGAALSAGSWTASPVVLQFDTATGKTIDSLLQAPAPVDFSDIEAREVTVAAKDGTEIPLSILAKRGLVLDHSHPTLLEGYGAYGSVRAPYFDRLRRAWFDRGGIFAVAHVRGGGEFGEPWHQAGMLANKTNTVTDFITCAQYLIDKGYTSSRRLAATGGSAGGILVGGAITARPDLFAAVLITAGMNNALRLEQIPIGPFNTPEFGSVATAEGFKMLMAVDAYQHVRSGVRYPAVMLSTGLNDARVSPWQSGKMAARLQAATASGRPVLLRVDAESGHLGGNRAQGEQLRADQYAFLLWQMGVRGFQPQPSH